MKTTNNEIRKQEVKQPKTVKLSHLLWIGFALFTSLGGWFGQAHYTTTVNATIDREVTKRFEQSKTNQ